MKVDYFNTFAANSPAFSNYVSPRTDKNSKSPQKLKQSPYKTNKKELTIKKSRKQKNVEFLNGQKLQKKKNNGKKNYEIDPMYASKISQMLSEVSVGQPKNCFKFSQIADLQSKVTSQILILRQQKIHLMEQLNNVADKKNKCIQMIQTFKKLKEREFQDQQNQQYMQNGPYSRANSPKHSAKTITDTFSSKKKMQEDHQKKGNIFKIKDQILSPLLQHPLLAKNKDLKEQLRVLTQELESQSMSSVQFENQLASLLSENKAFQRQISIQNQKLKKMQKQRLATFFPKDKKRIDQINFLLSEQQILLTRKDEIEKNISSRTIIRTAQDDLWVQELKQQNIRLMKDVETMLQNHRKRVRYEYSSIQQLQRIVEQQLNGKRNFVQNLQNFKNKVRKLQQANKQLKSRQRKTFY